MKDMIRLAVMAGAKISHRLPSRVTVRSLSPAQRRRNSASSRLAAVALGSDTQYEDTQLPPEFDGNQDSSESLCDQVGFVVICPLDVQPTEAKRIAKKTGAPVVTFRYVFLSNGNVSSLSVADIFELGGCLIA